MTDEMTRLRTQVNEAVEGIYRAAGNAIEQLRPVFERLNETAAALTQENAELRGMKVAYQETPKQWSTAQSPTLEAVAATAAQINTEAENKRLREANAVLLAACRLWDEGFTEGELFTAEQFRRWVNANRRAAREAIAKATAG